MYTYRVVNIEALATLKELEELLNVKGEAGWEICHVDMVKKMVIFKKESIS